MQATSIAVSDAPAGSRSRSMGIGVAAYGWLIASAALLALVFGLAIRIEWLTPALDAMQARTFGAALTLHGALSFYFVLLPLGFTVPALVTLRYLSSAGALPFPRLTAWGYGFYAAGLGTLVVYALAGGSEAGWSGANVFGGIFEGARPIGLAGLCAALSLVAHGIQAASSGGIRTLQLAGMLSIFLPAAGVMALLTGAALALCMTAVLLDGLGGVHLFDPVAGGDPRMYFYAFSMFRSSALSLVVLAPLLLSAGWLEPRAEIRVRPRSVWTVAALAVFSALPLGGTGLALKFAACSAACLAIGLLAARMAQRAPMSASERLLPAALFIGGLQALLGQFLLATPVGAQISGQTTLESACLHLAAMTSVGFAWPAVALLARSNSGPQSAGLDAFIVAAALVLFAGIQVTVMPDALTGLHGLSFRANAYPADFQVLKVLGAAGSTIFVVGFALLYIALWRVVRNSFPAKADASA
ncbi:MAG: hypothetical protein NZ740_05345 [Kiritimatiellae bacterium]|nr:hypothetical protein [Kiritimatiellia bacterium]MDW8458518.1 hypothetical protein [Verrucomicrobiota bacterium]